MEADTSWKTKVMLAGAIVGALTGLGAAYLYVKKSDEMAEKPRLTSGEGMKIGLGVVGLLKMITDLGNR